MRVLVALSVVAVLLCGVTYADEALSPEAAALKAKYDAKIKALQDEFAAELAAVNARVEALEKPAPAAKKWYDNVMINGYFQARFETADYEMAYGAGAKELDEFDIRRLYINLIAPVDKKTTGVVTWAGVGGGFRGDIEPLNSEADWANIFVDYKPNAEWTIRVGQAGTWFGLDTCESSSCRFTPERALFSEGSGKIRGLYFAGPWDRGIWVVNDQTVKSADKTGLKTVASIHNGNFRSQDTDNSKNVSLDLEYFFPWGQAGVSWLDGTFGGATRDALGANVRVLPGKVVDNWGFQAEFVDGEWVTVGGAPATDTRGFYLQGSYHFDNHPGTAYVRYEQFDPDTNTDDVPGGAANEFEVLHLGYIYDLTAKDKITVEYGYGEQGDADMDNAIVQYQRMF